MAGYNVQTPPLFTVRDPQVLVGFNLATLNATISTPSGNTVVNSANNATLLADALLGGLIVRTGAGGNRDDTTDSAANIIDAIKLELLGLANKVNLPNGTSVECTYTNNTDYLMQIVGGDNVDVCYPNYVESGCTVKLNIVVVDQESLGGVDTVKIAVCGGYED